MARPLTDYQWIILWELQDHGGSVFWRDGNWFMVSGPQNVRVSDQVRALLQRKLIILTPGNVGTDNPLRITQAGQDALEARDYMAVLDRWNSR